MGAYSIAQSADASEKCLKANADGTVGYWTPSAFNHTGILWNLDPDDSRTRIDEKRQELTEAIASAEKFYNTIKERISDKIPGSYTEGAGETLRQAIEAARTLDKDPQATVEAIEGAGTQLQNAMNESRQAPTVAFENGAVYRIKNADTRFGGLAYMYATTNNIVRWGTVKDNLAAENYEWKLTVEKNERGDIFTLYNTGTDTYLGSSAWGASRPGSITVTETPVPYQATNTFGDDPREWCLRSTDSYHVQREDWSYLACSGDNANNLAEGSIRPWKPTDAAGLHDAYWTFEEVEIPTGISSGTPLPEQIQVVNGRIVVIPSSTPYTVYSVDGKPMDSKARLASGIYIVYIQDKSYKVTVNS